MGLPNKNKKRRVSIAIVNVCRLLLAVVLLLSGLLKAVDPIGATYKLQEYVSILSIDSVPDSLLLHLAMLQAAVEFLLGLYLLVGIYRALVSGLTLFVMLFFTPLSLYLWLNGTIDDCGCFGESISISNKATFLKNVVLLAFALVVFFGRSRFVCVFSRKTRWVFVLFSAAYIFFLQATSISHLPVVDFSPYAKGKNLRGMVEYVPDEYTYVSVYQNEGVEIALSEDTVPSTDWTFVETRPVLVKSGHVPEINDFSILDWEYDIEMADVLLADTGYVCFVAIERMEDASVTHVDKLNDLYDHCQANHIRFCAATSSGDDEIALWRKRTGAEYPVYWADEAMLRTAIRSNPGLVLLKNGVIVGKWNVADIPDIEELESSPTLMPDGVWQSYQKMEGWPFWIVILSGITFFLALFDVVVLAVAILVGRKKREASTGDDVIPVLPIAPGDNIRPTETVVNHGSDNKDK